MKFSRKNYNITDLNNRHSVIEKEIYDQGEVFTSVFAYDKLEDKVEYIGTTFGDLEYYYNEKYIIFMNHKDVQYAFNFDEFEFINDEDEKEFAYANIMKSISRNPVLVNERNEIQLDADKDIIKSLVRRTKED